MRTTTPDSLQTRHVYVWFATDLLLGHAKIGEAAYKRSCWGHSQSASPSSAAGLCWARGIPLTQGLFVSVSYLKLPWSVSWVCEHVSLSVLCYTGCCQSSAAITRLCRLMACKMVCYKKSKHACESSTFSLAWKGLSAAVGHDTVRAQRVTQNSEVAGQTAKQCWDSLWSQ